MSKKYYLNFSDLSDSSQDELMEFSMNELEGSMKEELMEEAKIMNIDYESLLRTKAERHMSSFDFVFNV